MAEIPDIVYEKIRKLIDELEKNNIHITKAVLFGSYAEGTYNEWSDIDLALVSDNFTGDRWEDKTMLRQYKSIVGWDISVLPYRQKDFEHSFFVRDEILKKGLVII